VTHPGTTVAVVQQLHLAGYNQSQISRMTGINRSSVGEWIRGGRTRSQGSCSHEVDQCARRTTLPGPAYVYLLGLYLGDGCISTCPRDVFKLRITCCDAYPHLMDLCEEAMVAVLPNRVGRVHRVGCTELYSHSKHWPCLFPQHGPGRKHERSIVLAPWQLELVEQHPKELLRGLIHSDGCRSINTATGGRRKYWYWRYMFTNVSEDIRGLFCSTCDQLGIEWRQMNAKNISVAKRASVEFMDTFIGPKY